MLWNKCFEPLFIGYNFDFIEYFSHLNYIYVHVLLNCKEYVLVSLPIIALPIIVYTMFAISQDK